MRRRKPGETNQKKDNELRAGHEQGGIKYFKGDAMKGLRSGIARKNAQYEKRTHMGRGSKRKKRRPQYASSNTDEVCERRKKEEKRSKGDKEQMGAGAQGQKTGKNRIGYRKRRSRSENKEKGTRSKKKKKKVEEPGRDKMEKKKNGRG